MNPEEPPSAHPEPRQRAREAGAAPRAGVPGLTLWIVVALIAVLGLGVLIGWWLNRTPTAAPDATAHQQTTAPPASPTASPTPSATTTASTPAPSLRPTPTPVTAQTVVVTQTVTQRPGPPAPRKPTPPSRQDFFGFDRARFEHFTVEILPVEEYPSSPGISGVYARVCVNKTTDADHRTRISLDPWSFVDQDGRTREPLRRGGYTPAFPADDRYRVGDCAEGWISFKAFPQSDYGSVTVIYANGVGEKATWNFH